MLDHLNVAGATLAALLQSCYTNDRSCVGLLFGEPVALVLLAHVPLQDQSQLFRGSASSASPQTTAATAHARQYTA
jgi:hypothetical protein